MINFVGYWAAIITVVLPPIIFLAYWYSFFAICAMERHELSQSDYPSHITWISNFLDNLDFKWKFLISMMSVVAMIMWFSWGTIYVFNAIGNSRFESRPIIQFMDDYATFVAPVGGRCVLIIIAGVVVDYLFDTYAKLVRRKTKRDKL